MDPIVWHNGPGLYIAHLSGLSGLAGGSSGAAEITAVGTDGTHCKSVGWGTSGTDATVNVSCYNAAGTPTDSAFYLNFMGHTDVQAHNYGAHALADQPSVASYTPSSTWSYNTGVACGTLGTNTAKRTATGVYLLDHSQLLVGNAAIHVTAIGSDPNYCKVAGWSWLSGSSATEVSINCFNSSGVPADTQYEETYMSSSSRTGTGC
jgi:hypothetical protein